MYGGVRVFAVEFDTMPAAEANKDAAAMRNWEDYADPVFGLTRGAWEREVQQFGTEQSGSAPVVPEYRATIGTSRYTLSATSHLYLFEHHRAIAVRLTLCHRDARSQWMPPESSPRRCFARTDSSIHQLSHQRTAKSIIVQLSDQLFGRFQIAA